MSPAIPQLRPLRHPPARRGFSFAEVMFAVVILGIGFIMVAGIFPVALQQTQATSQQASAAAFAKNAAGIMQQLASYGAGYNFPTTTVLGQNYVYAFSDTINNPPIVGNWNAVAASLISDSDPRFAFVPLYMRPSGANYAQVYIITTQVQTRSAYDPNVTTTTLDPNTDVPSTGPTTFLPKLIQGTISGGSPYIITFSDPTPGAGGIANYYYSPATALNAVGTGSYVIVADDPAGYLNGKVYKVGNQRLDLPGSAWELVPGADFVPQTSVVLPTPALPVWIVGKQVDPVGSTNYAGKVQDLSLFTTFVSIPQ